MDSVAPEQDPRQGIYWLAELDSPPGIPAPIASGLGRTLGPSPGPPPLRLLSLQLIDRKAPTTAFIVLGSPFPFTGDRPGLNELIPIPTAPFAHLHGYALEFFGAVAPDGPQNGRLYHITLPRIGERPVEMWRQRAFVKDCKLYGELRWHPGTPELARIGGFEAEYTPKQLQLAEQGIALLRRIPKLWPRGGRPGDYDDANEPKFFDELGEAIHDLVRQNERVSLMSVAANRGKDRRTIKHYVYKFGYDLSAIEAEATRCTRRLSICTFNVRNMAKFKKKRV